MRLLFMLLAAVLCLYLTQDLQFFPGAIQSLWLKARGQTKAPPADVSVFMVSTEDQKELELWKLAAHSDASRQEIALLFHGNGDDLHSIFPMQKWFSEQGITTYSFDYRGFGRSSGWPSEQGLYRDATAIWKFIQEKETVSADNTIVVGYSLGAAVAAELARRIQPRLLILLAPFSSISSLLRFNPVFRYLRSLAWYEFPTASYVSELQNTCLVVVSSEQDEVIPASESKQVLEAYRGGKPPREIHTGTASHGGIFFQAQQGLKQELNQCFPKPASM